MLSIGTKSGMTVNDLEPRNGRYFALFRGIRPLLRTHPRNMLATTVYQYPVSYTHLTLPTKRIV